MVIIFLVLFFFQDTTPRDVHLLYMDTTSNVRLIWQQCSDSDIVHVYQISDNGLTERTIAPSQSGYQFVEFDRNPAYEYYYVISEGNMRDKQFWSEGWYEYRNLEHRLWIPIIQTE